MKIILSDKIYFTDEDGPLKLFVRDKKYLPTDVVASMKNPAGGQDITTLAADFAASMVAAKKHPGAPFEANIKKWAKRVSPEQWPAIKKFSEPSTMNEIFFPERYIGQ